MPVLDPPGRAPCIRGEQVQQQRLLVGRGPERCGLAGRGPPDDSGELRGHEPPERVSDLVGQRVGVKLARREPVVSVIEVREVRQHGGRAWRRAGAPGS